MPNHQNNQSCDPQDNQVEYHLLNRQNNPQNDRHQNRAFNPQCNLPDFHHHYQRDNLRCNQVLNPFLARPCSLQDILPVNHQNNQHDTQAVNHPGSSSFHHLQFDFVDDPPFLMSILIFPSILQATYCATIKSSFLTSYTSTNTSTHASSES